MSNNIFKIGDTVLCVRIHQHTDDRVVGKHGKISKVLDLLDMYLIDFGPELGCWCLGYEYVELAK